MIDEAYCKSMAKTIREFADRVEACEFYKTDVMVEGFLLEKPGVDMTVTIRLQRFAKSPIQISNDVWTNQENLE